MRGKCTQHYILSCMYVSKPSVIHSLCSLEFLYVRRDIHVPIWKFCFNRCLNLAVTTWLCTGHTYLNYLCPLPHRFMGKFVSMYIARLVQSGQEDASIIQEGFNHKKWKKSVGASSDLVVSWDMLLSSYCQVQNRVILWDIMTLPSLQPRM